MRDWLPALAYDRPVTVLMAFIALLVIGIIAWTRVPVQMMPSGFDPGFLWVQVPYPNASPTEVDERIVRPVEAQLGTVAGIQRLRSRADDGSAGFGIEFHSSMDMDEAYNTVVDRLERAMVDLPEDVERYWIFRYNPNDDPIVWSGVTLPETIDDPLYVLETLVKPRLERLPGVASVDFYGVPQQAVYVDYDKDRVYAHGIDLGGIQRSLSGGNFQMASGQVVDRGLTLNARSLARIESVEALRSFPIQGDIVLGDIADVRLRAAYSTDIWRIDGLQAASLAVRKEASANTIAVAEAVELELTALEADPRLGGATFFTFFSQGELVGESIATLLNTALTGGLFAVFILYMFLREWRMTLLIAASIPFSLLITVAVLYWWGGSLNLISLMGLMLAVGMVVDNAIVVIETIYRRRAQGAGVRAAAVGGVGEVYLAIMASTATTMVVFLPVILMSEDAMFSFFMGQLGFPVVFALAASLLVALVFAPLATRYIGNAEIKADPPWLAWGTDRYADLLGWALTHRVDATMALLAATVLTLGVAVPNVQCAGEMDENLNDFTIRFTVPPQASIRERDAIVHTFEELVEANREAWGVRVYRARLGSDDNRGGVTVYLDTDGPLPRDEVMEAAEAVLPTELPGVEATIGWSDGEQGGGNQVTLSVSGEDMSTLVELADEVARRVGSVPGVMDVDIDLSSEGADEIHLVIDRPAVARYGVSAQQVGGLVAYAMRGTRLPDLQTGEREIPVQAAFALADRSSLDTLLDYDVWSPALMSLVPVRSLTDLETTKGPMRIRRIDRRTSTGVTLDLAEDADMSVVRLGLDAALEDMVFPRGYSWSRGMEFDKRGEDDDATLFALLLSVCFVFLLMGVLFESFVLPLSIITTVPMAMAGAMWALVLTGTGMDTMAGVGLVILVGVVVNNGIVLVDLVEQLRAEGTPRTQALIEAGRRRLRPILMTAMTTICGLLPMAFGASAFIGIPYAPLGRTVIGGLIAATLLTLCFVPYLYAVLDDARVAGRHWVAWILGSDV
ncbi:MAG: HAE1 family hydrophobic/amphiphilic exporter-1 [Myxococcota bacterium]|jgi:HAE1 family hydrophobic/amphiphilic exporter-1